MEHVKFIQQNLGHQLIIYIYIYLYLLNKCGNVGDKTWQRADMYYFRAMSQFNALAAINVQYYSY